MEMGVHLHVGFRYTHGEAAHESLSIFCYSGSYSEQRPSKMCGHRALDLLVSVLFYARTAKFVRAQIRGCVGDMCVSHRQAKGRQHHLSRGKTLVRRLPGLADLIRQPCREKRMRKRKQYRYNYSRFNVQISKTYGKVGRLGPPSRRAASKANHC